MLTNQINARYSVSGWCGIAGGIDSQDDWQEWANGHLEMQPSFPHAQLESVPSRIARRLNGLGRCVMSVSERCLPCIKDEPAVIAVSRNGDIPMLDQLIRTVRDGDDVSPAHFSYSVHNRYASLISIIAGYRGINCAYSALRDGFAVALLEAASLIACNAKSQVLILAYEPEIPASYLPIISESWSPHAVAFALQAPANDRPVYSLLRHDQCSPDSSVSGSCLPHLRMMLNNTVQRDGFWSYQPDE